MAIGLSFMAGPLLGTLVVKSYQGATLPTLTPKPKPEPEPEPEPKPEPGTKPKPNHNLHPNPKRSPSPGPTSYPYQGAILLSMGLTAFSGLFILLLPAPKAAASPAAAKSGKASSSRNEPSP